MTPHSRRHHYLWNSSNAIFWYLTLGFVHELAHLLALFTLRYFRAGAPGVLLLPWAEPSFWFHLVVGRKLVVLDDILDGDDSSNSIIRHAGWLASVFLALCVGVLTTNRKRCSSELQTACWIVALEALWTDLFQWPTLPGLLGSGDSGVTSDHSDILVFCCGNFGMILLHHAWWTHDNGRTALDVLEKMIQVTMMRGAQSGGVICFHPRHHNNNGKTNDRTETVLRGVRSRVVNKKRTDLSVLLRQKVHRDNFSSWSPPLCGNGAAPFPQGFVPVLSGHTRFATSSKATLEGTHPQQWTPASPRRMFDLRNLQQQQQQQQQSSFLNDESLGQTSASRRDSDFDEPRVVSVLNCITHNGDFDFYRVNGKSYDLERIQKWLAKVLHHPMPASVDSCAVAGMIDLLRTQGCFGLSARHAICLGLPTSHVSDDDAEGDNEPFPPYSHFEEIGLVFENVLREMVGKGTSLSSIDASSSIRESFARRVASRLLPRQQELIAPLAKYIVDQGLEDGSIWEQEEEGASSLFLFCAATIRAFFDNDLFETTKTFLANATGSFGLCVTSSLDADRQVCLAARGQTMSLAFYPSKRMILYGSEQAAVKAGMNINFPGNSADGLDPSSGDVDNDALRLDLDDLGGEVVLLDYEKKRPSTHPIESHSPVSQPNRHLAHYKLMNRTVTAVIYKESKLPQDPELYHRMTRLSRNKFIKPLPQDCDDWVLKDIRDIAMVCSDIQDEWHSDQAATSLNRLTAHTLSRCLRKRLDAHVKGTVSGHAVDILLTGCEVSLWLAEQFASDLQNAFPKLRTMAVSSNKLLGLYGQDIAVPAFGFPVSATKTYDLADTIVIIVSHSGGTFAPLSCSNLMQSTSKNIFVVTSEWDTQIGKQLRAMDQTDTSDKAASQSPTSDNDQLMFKSRIFSTEVGIRPAEPCSLTVAATHQLLTNLLLYISVLILSDMRFRHASGATISEQDLQILERCNRDNLNALAEIVGVDKNGIDLVGKDGNDKALVETELREAGDLWANHVLENARAYIMTFCYIFVTVITGYPLASAIAQAAGLGSTSSWMYAVHTIDAAIYFWLPQVNIILLRLVQRRNLLHRMVGRTVVIGDIPWVAQAAEAFLSKIFAVSYSIAGLNVLSGNPADHLVHRHTHRVVRGSLVCCGRPDGRLSALSTAEAAVCLSVNQASSIQSWGGTCESITIGHNPFQLPLSAKGIFLKRKRPLFFCERLLLETDAASDHKKQLMLQQSSADLPAQGQQSQLECFYRWTVRPFSFGQHAQIEQDTSLSYHRDSSVRPRIHRKRSAAALLGTFRNFAEGGAQQETSPLEGVDNELDQDLSIDAVVAEAVEERKWSDGARKLFEAFDLDSDGLLSQEEFVQGAKRFGSASWTSEDLVELFRMADKDDSGALDYNEFVNLLHSNNPDLGNSGTPAGLMTFLPLPPSHRNERGLIQIQPSNEKYFGEMLRKYNAGKQSSSNSKKNLDFAVARSQEQATLLYETRIASLQRFVAMTVMFHQMGWRVERFFSNLGLGYRMDRTHSIMRIATTASPVSGADVRQRMRQLQLLQKVQHSVQVISTAYLRYREAKQMRALARQLASTSREDSAKEDHGDKKHQK